MSYRQGYRPQTQPAKKPAGTASRGRQQAKSKKKRKRGRSIRIFLLLVVLAFLATAGVMVYMAYDEIDRVERAGTFYPNVHIDNVPLNGASPQQAYDYLLKAATEKLAAWSVQIRYGDMSWSITPETLGLTGALQQVVEEEVNKAFMVGRNGSMIDRFQTITELKSEPYHAYTSGIEKNTAPIDGIISEIQAAINRPATDATRRFDADRKGYPFVVEPEINGLEVNAVALKAEIIDKVNNMEPGTIEIVPEQIIPAFTAAMMENDIMLIGEAVTKISSRSTPERTRNVEIGCERFNGRIVQDGEKVSFNSVVGKRTEKNGYQEAEEIAGGKFTMGRGGGICQTSSTLYNAVFAANLKVLERRNHGIPVNYLPRGADATVADDRIDFVFQNNTGAPIYFQARVDHSSSECIVRIYGRPDPNGYTYEMRHEEYEEIPLPDPEYVRDREAEFVVYTDQTHEYSKGSVGYKVRTYRVVRDAKGNVISDAELVSDDTYKAQAPVIYVGVSKRPE